MDLLSVMTEKYNSMLKLTAPTSMIAIHAAESQLGLHFPDELKNLLSVSDGIQELMSIDGVLEPIGNILYNLEDIVRWSRFYMATYGIKGIVFADDGAGDVYYFHEQGNIRYYHPICGEEEIIATSFAEFFIIQQ